MCIYVYIFIYTLCTHVKKEEINNRQGNSIEYIPLQFTQMNGLITQIGTFPVKTLFIKPLQIATVEAWPANNMLSRPKVCSYLQNTLTSWDEETRALLLNISFVKYVPSSELSNSRHSTTGFCGTELHMQSTEKLQFQITFMLNL